MNAAFLPKALSRACCASTTKHYDKTAGLWHNTRVRHCDRTRTLACHAHDASSFLRYKHGRPQGGGQNGHLPPLEIGTKN